ncbi:fibronectin type III domain-containing protein [Micromonospora sp. CPCC 206171]|uniref:fibronectin type III domain-containing protein n=1 Tax=Micromonospora sp. CPCC 206171 TaxID=3122405 RepID=UPI002FF23212
MTLNWTKSPTPNVYYLVEYKTSTSSTWTKLKLPVTSCCTFVAGYLANGTMYNFRLRATNLAGDSAASNTASAKPMPPLPKAPSNLSGYSPSPSQVYLSWTPSATPGVLYWMEYRTAGDSFWIRLPLPATEDGAGLKYGFSDGELHQFRVVAFNMAGESPATAVELVLVERAKYAYLRTANQVNGANAAARKLYGADSDCDPALGSYVCYGGSPGGDQPATLGDYFFYWTINHAVYRNQLRCEAYKRANIRLMSGRDAAYTLGPDLPRHEAVHSDQYAYYGMAFFLADYYRQSRASEDKTGSPALDNKYEKQANLYWGGYKVHPAPEYYSFDSDCSFWY